VKESLAQRLCGFIRLQGLTESGEEDDRLEPHAIGAGNSRKIARP